MVLNKNCKIYCSPCVENNLVCIDNYFAFNVNWLRTSTRFRWTTFIGIYSPLSICTPRRCQRIIANNFVFHMNNTPRRQQDWKCCSIFEWIGRFGSFHSSGSRWIIQISKVFLLSGHFSSLRMRCRHFTRGWWSDGTTGECEVHVN